MGATSAGVSQCRALRAWLEERRVRYVLAIPRNEVVPLPDGRTRQARELYAIVPEETFERRSCAGGSKGPREYDWASVQLAPTVEDFERYLLIRRSTVPNKKDKKTGELVREVAYFLCHTAPGTPWPNWSQPPDSGGWSRRRSRPPKG